LTYKKSTLITEAKQIKKFIEENKKIPKSSSLDNGKTLSPYSMSYLLSDLILNNGKGEYGLIAVVRYNTKNYNDTVNSKVVKSDYLKMIKNFVLYCKANGRVPAYITIPSSNVKVSFELYYYCISKIVVFLDENKVLPNYCVMNKSVFVTDKSNSKSNTDNGCSNKINSKTGCDAMGQNNNYYCGVSALQKCLYKLGIRKYTQKQLAQVCGTTIAGTSHQGLRTGVAYVSKKENIKLTVTEKNFSDYTPKQIKEIICSPNKAIIFHNLYRLKYGHYEFIKAVNTSNNEFQVINSLGNKCQYGCFCGYIEKRSYKTMKSYASGISQPSLIIITKG